MKIASACSALSDTQQALVEAYGELCSKLEGAPSMLFCHPTAEHNMEQLVEDLQSIAPGVPVHGATSCQGVMTEERVILGEGYGLGLLGVYDEEGGYGVGFSEVAEDARSAAREALLAALKSAGREGEAPDAIFVSSLPGVEEEVLLGIQEVVGLQVPVLGGSAADNDVIGEWSQFSSGRISRSALVVSVLFPSGELGHAFHSGYMPTRHKGTATRVEGRILWEIDHRPAIEVYNEWTDGRLSAALQGTQALLMHSTLDPLGRQAGDAMGVPYYMLSHPASVVAGGGLSLFTQVHEGELMVLMEGSMDSLVTRAARVVDSAVQNCNVFTEDLAGGLLVYCAGCMLTVRDRMEQVREEINQVMGGRPYLGIFTFGEQGCVREGDNRHGNLMISFLALGDL